MPDRYLLYIRQSITTDAADSLSLAFQERELRALVAKRGGVVIEPPIADPDEKGNDPARPGIEELIQRVQRQTPDAIAVYAVSRFARDNWLQEGIWRRLKQIRPELRFESATEPHAEDDLVRGILGVVSQAERKRMGKFLSSSFQERALRGLPHGRTPFGYQKDESGRLVVDDDHAEIVRGIVQRLEQGASLWQVSRGLNASGAGGRSWEPNSVRNTVTSHAIAGAIKCGETIAWDTHDPIIDRERWERLRSMLASRPKTRTKPVSSWLEGLLDCGCGAPMHLVYNKGRYPVAQFRCSASPSFETYQRSRRHPPCTHTPRSIVLHKAERLTLDALSDALGSVLTAETVYERTKARYDALSASSGAEIRKLEKQIARLSGERERLLVVYRRGSLDVDRWEAEDRALGARLDVLARELDVFGAAPEQATFTAQAQALEQVRIALAVDPTQARNVLLRFGARVQLRLMSVVRVVWPEEIAPFFLDGV